MTGISAKDSVLAVKIRKKGNSFGEKKNLMIQPMKLIQHAGQSREELAQLRKKCRNASSFVL